MVIHSIHLLLPGSPRKEEVVMTIIDDQFDGTSNVNLGCNHKRGERGGRCVAVKTYTRSRKKRILSSLPKESYKDEI